MPAKSKVRPGALLCALLIVLAGVFAPSAHAQGTTPGLNASATNDVKVGEPVTFSSTVSGQGNQRPTGTVTYRVYGPDDGCANAPVIVQTVDVEPDSFGPSDGFATTSGDEFLPVDEGDYAVTASYSGDSTYTSAATDCGVTTFRVHPPRAVLTATHTDAVAGEEVVFDATVSGAGGAPTGTVTFTVYDGEIGCNTDGVEFTQTVALTPDTDASVAQASTGQPQYVPSFGYKEWDVTYSGDGTYQAETRGCHPLDVAQSPRATTFEVRPSAPGYVGYPLALVGEVYSTAAATAGTPTGSVTLRLYGPDDPDCEGVPVLEETRPLDSTSSPATATTGEYTPTVAGLYPATIAYSGDADYNAVAPRCGDDFIQVVVAPEATATPGSLTFASAAAPQPVGTTGRTQVVTITNTGDGTTEDDEGNVYGGLTFGAVELSDPDEFVINGNTCGGQDDGDGGFNSKVLAPDESCTIGIRFTPQEPGERTGSLTIASDDPASPTVVALSGTAASIVTSGGDGIGGAAGTDGKDGAAGEDGTDGTSGTNGTNGTNGSPGAGTPGPAGPAGPAAVLPPGWEQWLAAVSGRPRALCTKALATCRIVVTVPVGQRFVSATITGRNGKRTRAYGVSAGGSLLDANGRAIRLVAGTYSVVVRLAARGKPPVARTYTVVLTG